MMCVGGAGSPSFVLDCIDDLATKADLLAACSERGLRVISSLGAALKADPTRWAHCGVLCIYNNNIYILFFLLLKHPGKT